MKKIGFVILSTIAITLMLNTFVFSGSEDLVKILLLNSYHDGYDWSDETKQGVKDVLDTQLSEYYLRIEHMDTKNVSTDDYMEELVALYKIKFDSDEFDIIMCADDNALKFLLLYGRELFGDTPVFFSGVNSLSTHDLSEAENFYGVVEKHSIVETTELALLLNPDIKRVYLLVDNSITGRATKKAAIKDMAKLEDEIDLIFYEYMSFDKIIEAVKQLDPKEDLVIQSYYVVDKDGTTYPLEYTARKLVTESAAPVFGIFSFGFGEGSVGGKFLEGYTQGERAAEMVVEYIETGSIEGEQFIVDESFNRCYFDYEVMGKFNYDHGLLPEESIIINKPVTFYAKHSGVINVSLGILGLLLIYVFILQRQIRIQTNRIVNTQSQLLETEKMASLGRLVAGVAHEVNTPIGIGVSLASYLEKETDKILDKVQSNQLSGQEFKAYIEKVSKSSESMASTMERAAELVQNFKQVAVDQTLDEKRPINLTNYIEDIISSLKSELKHKDVEIEVIAKETILIYSYTGALYQIMLNLIMNSLKHGFEGGDMAKLPLV